MPTELVSDKPSHVVHMTQNWCKKNLPTHSWLKRLTKVFEYVRAAQRRKKVAITFGVVQPLLVINGNTHPYRKWRINVPHRALIHPFKPF
jgi:hypothetical protein